MNEPLLTSPLGTEQQACGNRAVVENPTTIRVQRERPILFKGAMVRAILDGKKTQTRRIVKTTDGSEAYVSDGKVWKPAPVDWSGYIECPQGAPGDRLWVKETHALYALNFNHAGCGNIGTWHPFDRDVCCHYREGCPSELAERFDKWRPSIFMPRWASRLTLQITGVRVERLQAITEDDARAEGIVSTCDDPATCPSCRGMTHRRGYHFLWNEINGPRGPKSWDANPWVWVITFRRIV